MIYKGLSYPNFVSIPPVIKHPENCNLYDELIVTIPQEYMNQRTDASLIATKAPHHAPPSN